MPVLLSVLLTVTLLGSLSPGGTFTDDDKSVHEGGIEAIAEEGITIGCNPPFNDRFCPDRQLTRAEMATMISRALGLDPASSDYFVDDDGHVLEGAINRIAEAGVTQGCNPPTNDRFCPNRSLTRAEAAAFMARAIGLGLSATDYFVDDDGHVLEGAINRIAEAGVTQGCNPPTNDRFCPNRILTRAEMATMLTRAFGYSSMKPPDRPPLDWELVAEGFASPVQVLAPPGEDRLLIAEQGGLVRIYDSGSIAAMPFLDLTAEVSFGGERGLLAIALHPDYPTDRRLFVWYYGTDSRTHLVEYDIAADLATASSPRTVLSVTQPAGNHNGGFISFGTDGYLYLGLGDGGGANDTYKKARDLSTLLGKMVRIDVDSGSPYGVPADNPYVGVSGARDEIWASGLRNPWRWSFDDGYIYIGDVGQGAREEVNVVPAVPVGYDFGWPRYEGSLCNPNDSDASCATSGLTFPVEEYGRSAGRSVTGGVVYRGDVVRSLDRFYLYADVFSGRVFGFRLLGGHPVEQVDLTSRLGLGGIVSFAADDDGEILVVSLFDGAVYRLTGG